MTAVVRAFFGYFFLVFIVRVVGRRPGKQMTLIFFVASSAASAAYLTVSEIFPLEIRAFAIAVFYGLGTLTGGVAAPLLFGVLIATVRV
jgi:uncharacterized membrane protein YcaP (DUF421 family)